MIAAYNRAQILKAIGLIVLSIVCYGIAWLFFAYGLAIIFHMLSLSGAWLSWVAPAAMLVITWSGYRQWQKGDGFKSYVESSLFHDLGDDSGSAVWTDIYAHRVTGPAYVISQICLGGPLFLLKAWKHLQQRLTAESGLETRLQQVLTTLRTANKWQSIDEYPSDRREILMLAQMKQIDFSAHKGTPRIKASPPAHGV
ncbi:hypothetical protein [Brevifollis gellanilyticus]|uniref:Uncharacterized protein n=1 Tax=Brevifollis gellanilyticus TaxID=748831 RepID=A0A512M241_9BACT|nr:hypothetical protein [Brevifollis gellanilyticus]GEP40802.1 hypothetical protein BGE01nite_00930 [Brevifollis gellanilyticus]